MLGLAGAPEPEPLAEAPTLEEVVAAARALQAGGAAPAAAARQAAAGTPFSKGEVYKAMVRNR